MPLVQPQDTWHYRKGLSAPQADWKTAPEAALDGSWLTGPGGIGYGDGDDATVLADMRGHYTTVYLRRRFTVSTEWPADWRALLTVDWDDGFVAWLDGVEVARDRAPGATGAEPPWNATATGLHESSHGGDGTVFDLGAAGEWLPPGDHVLAFMVLNESASSSDLSLIARLEAAPPPPPPPGTLTADTHWTAADSPVVLNGDLTVGRGVTLTIDPGVEVQLAGGADLVVEGRLLAEGTAEAPILFRNIPGGGSWGGIQIQEAGGLETRIGYARFIANGDTAVHSVGGDVHLHHLEFTVTSRQYVSLDDSSFIVRDCVFPTATSGFELVHGTGGIKSGGRGLFLRNFFGAAQGYNDVVDFTGGNRPGPIVQFIDNVFVGSGDDLLDLDGTDAWIEHNIFLHAHKNGSPDTASAISGGSHGGATSEITIIGNLFYDCDQAAMAKEGNFYVLLHNTIVRQTHQGGLDNGGAVVALADEDTSQGRGMYLEGNIVVDAEQLTRFHTTAVVTFTNNFLPLPWDGPGGGNVDADPRLRHIPEVAETFFDSWEAAQVMWEWFSLQPDSPARGAGPEGRDAGGVIPLGVSLRGAPIGMTEDSSATLEVGPLRKGPFLPISGWPEGAGYTHYRWRLDGGEWSAPTPTETPIVLSDLAAGTHWVEVVGLRDSGLYQDDPVLGPDAVITRTPSWTVVRADRLRIEGVEPLAGGVAVEFLAVPGFDYRLLRSGSLAPALWEPVAVMPPVDQAGPARLIDPDPAGAPAWFYRIEAVTAP